MVTSKIYEEAADCLTPRSRSLEPRDVGISQSESTTEYVLDQSCVLNLYSLNDWFKTGYERYVL